MTATTRVRVNASARSHARPWEWIKVDRGSGGVEVTFVLSGEEAEYLAYALRLELPPFAPPVSVKRHRPRRPGGAR